MPEETKDAGSQEETKEETSETSEETSTQKTEEKTVPYSRFQDVNKKMRDLEDEVESLKKESTKETTTEDKETKSEEQKIKDVLSKLASEKSDKEKSEQRQFERQVDDTLELNPSIKRADFLKFMEEKAETYGIKSVEGGIKLFKDLGNVKEETKPGDKALPKSEGFGDKGTSYDVEGKSMNEIIEDSIKDGNLK